MEKRLLPVLAAVLLSACINSTTNDNRNKQETTPVATAEERVIVIPSIKDTSSIHQKLRPLTTHRITLPFIEVLFADSVRPQLAKGPLTMEYSSDTMKLHIKGDSCWIEYISAGKISTKKKDGTIVEGVTTVNETTDKVLIR